MDKVMKNKYARIIELAFLITHDASSNIVEVDIDLYIGKIWVIINNLSDRNKDVRFYEEINSYNLDDIIVEMERLYECS